jgi:hypothetical protein
MFEIDAVFLPATDKPILYTTEAMLIDHTLLEIWYRHNHQ